MIRTAASVLGLTLLLGLGTACAPEEKAVDEPAGIPGSVLLLGDSVAAAQAIPLTEAFAASNVRFRSLASDGGGNVVGPAADQTWRTIPAEIAEEKPAVVVYQITTYDWGSENEQRDAYARLATTVTGAGAKLVLVTMPPIRPDDFYRPHLADLDRTRAVAAGVAADGKAHLLDAAEVWGETYQRERAGKLDRSSDGIHPCPQGAARFAGWLLNELTTILPGFTPAEAETWANTGWSGDRRFVGC